MISYDELPLSKVQQRRKRKPKAVAEVYNQYPPFDGNEAQLQSQMNDLLEALAIEYRRISDNIWRWLVNNAPVHIVKILSDLWKSKPDTLALIPVSDKYSLALEVELKSKKGQLNQKQAAYKKRMPVQVSRSPDQNIDIVRQFQADASIVKGLFQAQQLNNGGGNGK